MSGNRGSQWNKWDLHLHSHKTWLNNQFGEISDDDFVNKIVESGIKAVGLTNYFRFTDGEINGDDNLKSKLEAHGVIVFPNLEFRLSYANKQNELCDYHIVFSPNLGIAKINNFLTNLDVVANGTNKKASALTDDECRANTTYVDFNKLHTTLNDRALDLTNQYLCGFLSRGHGEARSSAVPDYICNKSDFLIHSSDSEENVQSDYEFWTKDNSKPIKPVYQGSDAHKLDDIGTKFTWIKAQLTFDGLKQTLYNPAERTSFNENNPSEIKTEGMIIDKITYGDNKEVLLNPDLNSIIGRRASGKSILLKGISLMVDEGEFQRKISDNDKFTRDKNYIGAMFPDLKIIWCDRIENSGNEENAKKVFFIPQGYLSNLAYDENSKASERDKFLIELLRKNDSFKKAELQSRSFVDTNSQDINVLIDRVLAIAGTVEQLLNENKAIGNIAVLKKEIVILSERIKIISEKNKITEDDNKNYQEAIGLVARYEKELASTEQDTRILKTLRGNDDLIQVSDNTIANLSDQVKAELTQELKAAGKEKIQTIIVEKLTSLNGQSDKLQKQLEVRQQIIITLKPKFEQQNELKELTNKKLELEKNVGILSDNSKKLEAYKTERASVAKSLRDSYFNFKTNQSRIFETVNFAEFEFIKIDEIDIKIDTQLKANFIDRNINRNGGTRGSSDCTQSFVDKDEQLNEDNFVQIINDFIDNKVVYKKEARDTKQVIRDLLDNPYKIDFLDSIKTKDGDTLFRDMTGGQKAIVMLELIFKFDTNNYPILIDQPEDDLDTSGVATNVVEFIKKQKARRQIFIVSHNASLVVCSDSEEIIVAQNQDGFSYNVGAIEDDDIRSAIIDVLEGGQEALKLRMNKLGVRR